MTSGDSHGAGLTESPWAADVELSEPGAANLIASQFPELTPASITTLSDGVDTKTFELDGRTIFRFPKRAASAVTLEAELELLPLVAARLPVAVPEIAWVGRASSAFPFSFVGYPKLPGVTARTLRRRGLDVAALGHVLGPLLTALHTTPAADARAAGVGVHSPVRDLVELRARARAALTLGRRDLPDDLAERLPRFLDGETPVPAAHDGPLAVVHNALFSEHLLVDPSAPRVTGLVAWGDAGLGDPAADLAGLWAWLGAPLVDAVLARYDAPLDAHARARARFIGTCLGVLELAHGLRAEQRDRVAAAIHTLGIAAAEGVLPPG